MSMEADETIETITSPRLHALVTEPHEEHGSIAYGPTWDPSDPDIWTIDSMGKDGKRLRTVRVAS